MNKLDKAKKQLKKKFLNNFGLLFSMTEKVPNDFKSRFFPKENLDKIPIHQPTRELTSELATELTKHKEY